MLSLNSAKAPSREARGKSALLPLGLVLLGVVCEARRLVREGGRKGVVGRDGRVLELEDVRWWFIEPGGAVAGVVEAIWGVLCTVFGILDCRVHATHPTRLGSALTLHPFSPACRHFISGTRRG